MPNSAVVRARIDEKIKQEAADVLANMGLTVSDAVRMTLTAIARDKALPFELRIPNQETLDAMAELENGGGKSFKNAEELFKDLGI
ncbi:MAG: type II toxin-antitoxin system RelB/DinJ family antitoxin [Desulfovibrionaceae bacterium]|nr:type II toxin-antitoxin system RelB/DinJ family antitoxin [Desulfovibrionaceae bacterium]